MKRRVNVQTYILGLLSLAMASFLLIHFALIWALGRFYIYESNPLVLSLETTGVVAILLFSFYCVVDQLRREKSGEPGKVVR